MGTDAPPYLMLEFGQIYSVRTLEQGEHERVRVKPNDAKRVIQLAYEEEESTRAKISPADEFVSLIKSCESIITLVVIVLQEGVVQIRGHHFIEARNSSRSSCDVCGKTLPLALLSGGIFECKGRIIIIIITIEGDQTIVLYCVYYNYTCTVYTRVCMCLFWYITIFYFTLRPNFK